MKPYLMVFLGLGLAVTISFNGCSEMRSANSLSSSLGQVCEGSLQGKATNKATVDTDLIYKVAIDAYDAIPQATPVTFGLALGRSQLPFSMGLVATINIEGTTTPLPLQVDKKVSSCEARGADGRLSHEFGSKESCPSESRFLRHAVVTTHLPMALQEGERAEVMIYGSNQNSDGNIPNSIPFPEELRAEIHLSIEGLDYVAAIDPNMVVDKDLATSGSAKTDSSQWLDGAFVREWHLNAKFKRKTGGGEHSGLEGRFVVRRYAQSGKIKVDAIVENTKSFSGEMKSYKYGAKVFVNNVLRYDESNMTHFPHARWRTSHWASGYPDFHVIHDPAFLIQSGVTPNYDPKLFFNTSGKLDNVVTGDWDEERPQESSGLLSFPIKEMVCYDDIDKGTKGDCDDPATFKVSINTFGPMGIGPLVKSMPTSGGRSEIGPLPQWTAGWVVSQKNQFHDVMMAIADTSGSWSIHFRDESTGVPVSIEDHPTLALSSEANPPEDRVRSCDFGPDCIRVYKDDTAHQPSIAFLPYIISGDYYLLEEVQFWASRNNVTAPERYRGYELGLVESANQTRGSAWSLRNLAQAAFASPDNHQLKPHFESLLKNNAVEYESIYLSDPDASNTYGALVSSGQGGTVTSPWQDDYVTFAVGYAVGLGYESYKDFASWKGRFSVQRMGYGSDNIFDFCPTFAASYRLIVGPRDEIPLSSGEAMVTIKKGPRSVPLDRVMFKDIRSVFRMSNKATNGGHDPPIGTAFETREVCDSEAQFIEQDLDIGEINGNSGFTDGYGAQLGVALATAVDMNTAGAENSWLKYSQRAGPPSYEDSPTWAVVPRSALVEGSLPFPPQEDGDPGAPSLGEVGDENQLEVPITVDNTECL